MKFWIPVQLSYNYYGGDRNTNIKMPGRQSCPCVIAGSSFLIDQHALRIHEVHENGRIYVKIQGDQKISVHLMITIQKVTSNVQSVPCQTFTDTRLKLKPSVIPISNYVIMVSD
jgi:hypothetical protein